MSSAASESESESEAPSRGEDPAAAAAAAAAAALLLWERAWSLEEVRAGSQGWSLAADAGLLRFLQEFSQQTLARTHEIKKQMDRLVHETKTTDCRLHNVFSGFLMLSNTQFIENRVYDDEVEEPMPRNEAGDKPEQEKTREQKEADLIPKIQEAVNYGLQVLDSAFEQLDIKAGNSDSEEETTERMELILEPKDLYIDRPLPYLIGSHLFMEQDDVGLGDLSSEEGSVGSDRGSMIESEGKDEEESEEFDDGSEEEQRLKTVLISDEEDYLFGDSEKGEEEEEGDLEVNARQKMKRPTSFTDELAARITKDVPDVKSKTTVTEKEDVNVSSDDDDIFKPPKLTDEDFLPFASKGGLFSGGRGLFDDEESDLFAEAPQGEDAMGKETRIPINDEPASKAARKLPAGAVSLFPGRNDVFSPTFITEKEKKEPIEPIAEKGPKLHENSGLFDGDDADDFKSSKESSVSAKPAADLFEAEGDLFKQRSDVTSVTNDAVKEAREKKEVVTGDKSQPDSAEIFKPLTQTSSKGQISLFSDEEDSEDLLFSNQSSKGNKPLSSSKVATKTQVSLFEDEDEEELFGPLPKMQTSKPPQVKATGVLFSSDEEDHWNITQEVKPASECSQTKKPINTAPAVSHNVKKCLFEEEKEEDLFAITKESPKTPQKPALLLDDEDDDVDGDMLFKFQPSPLPSATVDFLETPQKKLVEEKTDSLDDPDILHSSNPGGGDVIGQQKAPLEKNNGRKVKSVFSLFEEEEKNEDMDASKNTQKETPPEGSVCPKSTGVFQDEELLFSHNLQKDNDPDVDLFAQSKKEDLKPRVKLPSEQGLFGADDDGDDSLFGSSKAKPLAVEKETIKKASTISSFKDTNKISESHPKVKREDDSSLEANENTKPSLLYPKTPVYELQGGPHSKIPCVAGSSKEMGVSFDYPVQANTLQNANKGRIKMTGKRRPPTRSARRLAAQDSSKNELNIPESPPLSPSTEGSSQQDVRYPYNERRRKENAGKGKLFLPASSNDQLHEAPSPVLKSTAHLDIDDLFESNDLFSSSVSHKVSSGSKTSVETKSHVSRISADRGPSSASLPLDGATCEDLFPPAKVSKESSPGSVLKGKEDLFTTSKAVKRKDPKPPPQSEQNLPAQDIFEDDIFASEAVKLPVKVKDLEANLFDDDVDIFADLAEKPKEKSTKKKVEAKSIFDEDTDDIFSSVSQSKTSTRKAPSFQAASGAKCESKTSSGFEDPLNAFEGQ